MLAGLNLRWRAKDYIRRLGEKNDQKTRSKIVRCGSQPHIPLNKPCCPVMAGRQALGIDLAEFMPNGPYNSQPSAENNNMKTQEQTILRTYSRRSHSVGEPDATASLEVLKEETRAWHRIYCAENSCPEISARRWLQIEDELERNIRRPAMV